MSAKKSEQTGRPRNAAPPIVGVGASAGGLEAFEAFLKAMPGDSGLAFVLAPHMDPQHVSLLPQLLQRHTKMKVAQVEDGTPVAPNCVYIIPPNRDLAVLNGALQLMDPSHAAGARYSIDSFLRSLAQDQGPRAVAVILSGAGTDGTLGIRAVKAEGGLVIVQEPDSAKYDSMPRSAAATGLADYVLAPENMAAQIVGYVRHGLQRPGAGDAPQKGDLADALPKVFVVLRARSGHDFSHYKHKTLYRRIERRMHMHRIDNISDYVRYLQDSEREAQVLFRELLIGVTQFFRDPEAFDALRQHALPALLGDRPDDDTVRVWAPGCSTGEEAYSIAILLLEHMRETGRRFGVQIFGTDLDDQAIATARQGVYPASIAADVTPERLQAFFAAEGDCYRVRKHVRELLVFATHSVIKDPPFTKLDLLSCRNLLIYLDVDVQRKVLAGFHYALKPDGILFLGSSETVGHAADLFDPLDKKWRVFRRKEAGVTIRPTLVVPAAARAAHVYDAALPVKHPEADLTAQRLAEAVLELSDAPPCAVIDEAGDVVYVHGRTGRFLEMAEGKGNVNVVDMAREGLRGELPAAIRAVRLGGREMTLGGLEIKINAHSVFADVTLRPIHALGAPRSLIMISFHEIAPPTEPGEPAEPSATTPGGNDRAKDIEFELERMREGLQTTIEELETSNEELMSANEELQSTNEELQSTNEELETSQEELQSLNEESATVNAELQDRMDELAAANDDMKNLLDSTRIATIFLDRGLCIRRFTPMSTDIIPLAGGDIGRPLSHFATSLEDVDMNALAAQTLADLAQRERTAAHKDGRRFLLRTAPYRTADDVIDGVVITFTDFTGLEKAERAATEARRYAEAIVNTVRNPLLVLDRENRVVSANPAFYRTFKTRPADTEDRPLWELGNGQWNVPELRVIEKILPERAAVDDFAVEHDFPGVGRRRMLLNARRMASAESESEWILLAMEDVTGRNE